MLHLPQEGATTNNAPVDQSTEGGGPGGSTGDGLNVFRSHVLLRGDLIVSVLNLCVVYLLFRAVNSGDLVDGDNHSGRSSVGSEIGFACLQIFIRDPCTGVDGIEELVRAG